MTPNIDLDSDSSHVGVLAVTLNVIVGAISLEPITVDAFTPPEERKFEPPTVQVCSRTL